MHWYRFLFVLISLTSELGRFFFVVQDETWQTPPPVVRFTKDILDKFRCKSETRHRNVQRIPDVRSNLSKIPLVSQASGRWQTSLARFSQYILYSYPTVVSQVGL